MVKSETMVNYLADCLAGKAVVLFYFIGYVLTVRPVAAQPDTTFQLKAVTVKGSSVADVQTITPSQVAGSADFRKYSAYNVADAIRNFSGVNIKDYGGIGGLKTVSVRSLGASHTAVQYDGVPVTDMQNGQIDLGKINLDNVHSITLYNGQPGEICQPARSFAAASVLVINSLPPRLDSLKPSKIKTGITTGSFGLVHPSVQWQQRLGGKWALNVNSSYQQAHGRYRFKVQDDGSDTLAIRTNAALKTLQNDVVVFWQKNDSIRLNIRANLYHSDRGLPGAVVFYNPYSNQHLWNRDFFLQSGFDKKWRRSRLLLKGKYTRNYTRYLDPDYLNSDGKLDQRYHQQEYYTSGSFLWKTKRWLELAFASDFSLSTLRTSMYGFAYPTRFTYLNAGTARLKFDKAEVQGTLLNTLIHETVRLGDAASGRSVWSPALLATYQPFQTPAILLRAFYKDIFRNPTFNDLYYSRSGNRSLKPEFAQQYNLGFTFSRDFEKRVEYVTMTTDFYYNYVKDKIIAVPNKDLFSWTMLNLGEVDIRGMDLAAKTQVRTFGTTRAVVAVNYTFQEALDVTDPASSVYLDQIPYTPRHSLSFNMGFDDRRWAVFVNQTYASHRYYLSENLPEHYVPGFFVTDLSGRYRFRLSGNQLTTSLEINNLTDTDYAFIRSFPMPGRSYRFSIQISI